MHLQNLKLLRPTVYEKIHLQENTLYDLDPKMTLTLGSRSHIMLPSTLHIMLPMHLLSLKLLCPMLSEKMHLREKTLFDLDQRSHDVLPSTLDIMIVIYAHAKF